MSNDANGDGAQREYAPPVFASSQFDREWDGMQGGADMAWNFDGPTEEERRMIEDVQKAMRNAARVEDDRQFFPWPDRGRLRPGLRSAEVYSSWCLHSPAQSTAGLGND
ncbi:unnamed protein product [Tilletia controversa]|nr:unnamed protein product [Tilletia controversa]